MAMTLREHDPESTVPPPRDWEVRVETLASDLAWITRLAPRMLFLIADGSPDAAAGMARSIASLGHEVQRLESQP